MSSSEPEDENRFSLASCFIPGKSKYRVIFIRESRTAFSNAADKPWDQMEYISMDMPKDIAQWFRVCFPNHVIDARLKPTKAERRNWTQTRRRGSLYCLLLWSLMNSSAEFEISVVGYEQF
ncbi:uncharacterized protein STEHIDRAFT_158871 [Stereum hirsutum FP-91666 SS1]|uniref:uncharacterized protein n=1 Tax=Stereum hirsutum (strain FP-91666) TaxID=721885 RepID=UPI0004449253|nr:uncharacterized protein STEHIDRAFT_158871 [Stereum hirsutum FP-91666 SS1]EIM85179.1 hypothetical protein STEHIDRAFT_158871 [Stereum hirsutum FP-91666 SS1]